MLKKVTLWIATILYTASLLCNTALASEQTAEEKSSSEDAAQIVAEELAEQETDEGLENIDQNHSSEPQNDKNSQLGETSASSATRDAEDEKCSDEDDVEQDEEEQAKKQTLADIYLKDVHYKNPNNYTYTTISAIALQEVDADDNKELPLKSDCVKYNTWLYGKHVSNTFENGAYEEKYNWNAAFVSWCANQVSLIYFGRFPRAYSGAELYAWFANCDASMFSRTEILSKAKGTSPEADDLLFFPINGEYRVGIVTSCTEGYVTYVMGDVDCCVRMLSKSMDELPGNIILVKWKTESDALLPYMDFLCNKIGFTPTAACGVLANIRFESGFNTHAVGDQGTSYGLCQWHNGRWDDLVSFCYREKRDWTTMEGQLYFLKYELEHHKHLKTLVERMNALGNSKQAAYDAAAMFCAEFEVPADIEGGSEKRGNYAATVYYPMLVSPHK